MDGESVYEFNRGPVTRSEQAKVGLIVKARWCAMRGHREKIEEGDVYINHQGAVVRAG